jgi:hypothetical protein
MVEAAGLEAMRSRSDRSAPEADRGLWRDPDAFFRQGGERGWRELLGPAGADHFHRRLAALAGDAADWVLHGRPALERDRGGSSP